MNAGVVYNGHNIIISQENESEFVPVCKVLVTVEWHFKLGKLNFGLTPAGVTETAPVKEDKEIVSFNTPA